MVEKEENLQQAKQNMKTDILETRSACRCVLFGYPSVLKETELVASLYIKMFHIKIHNSGFYGKTRKSATLGYSSGTMSSVCTERRLPHLSHELQDVVAGLSCWTLFPPWPTSQHPQAPISTCIFPITKSVTRSIKSYPLV